MGETRVNGVKLIVDNDMVVKAASKSEDGLFESETFKWIHMEFAGIPDIVFFDVGAYTGIYSFVMANHYLATCYAFEPNEAVYNRLLENKDLQLTSRHRIHTFPYGLSSQSGVLDLHTNAGTRLSSGGSVDKSPRKQKKQRIHLYKMDDLIYSVGINKLDLIKIDVEGHEIDVLYGAKLTLSTHNPDVIVECLDDKHLEQIKEFFEEIGYVLISEFDSRNYLFRSLKKDFLT